MDDRYRTFTGSRIMVSRCWHATISPGIIVNSSVIEVTDASILLNFYACSLVQSGVAQLEDPVERSGEFMLLGESFESDQLRRCLWHICTRDEEDKRRLYCDANIDSGHYKMSTWVKPYVLVSHRKAKI